MLYRPDGDYLICTNHFQSEEFAGDKYNIENIATSDSPYRHRRVEELINAAGTIDVPTAKAILRDSLGEGGTVLPPNDPRSITQSVAHHSVIFKPAAQLMWVSTGMGHSGEYVCYDLNEMFEK